MPHYDRSVVDSLFRAITKKRKVPRRACDLPASPGIYMLTRHDDPGPIKIGSSQDVLRRLDHYCHTFHSGFELMAVSLIRRKCSDAELRKVERDLAASLIARKLAPLQPVCGTRRHRLEWFTGCRRKALAAFAAFAQTRKDLEAVPLPAAAAVADDQRAARLMRKGTKSTPRKAERTRNRLPDGVLYTAEVATHLADQALPQAALYALRPTNDDRYVKIGFTDRTLKRLDQFCHTFHDGVTLLGLIPLKDCARRDGETVEAQAKKTLISGAYATRLTSECAWRKSVSEWYQFRRPSDLTAAWAAVSRQVKAKRFDLSTITRDDPTPTRSKRAKLKATAVTPKKLVFPNQ